MTAGRATDVSGSAARGRPVEGAQHWRPIAGGVAGGAEGRGGRGAPAAGAESRWGGGAPGSGGGGGGHSSLGGGRGRTGSASGGWGACGSRLVAAAAARGRPRGGGAGRLRGGARDGGVVPAAGHWDAGVAEDPPAGNGAARAAARPGARASRAAAGPAPGAGWASGRGAGRGAPAARSAPRHRCRRYRPSVPRSLPVAGRAPGAFPGAAGLVDFGAKWRKVWVRWVLGRRESCPRDPAVPGPTPAPESAPSAGRGQVRLGSRRSRVLRQGLLPPKRRRRAAVVRNFSTKWRCGGPVWKSTPSPQAPVPPEGGSCRWDPQVGSGWLHRVYQVTPPRRVLWAGSRTTCAPAFISRSVCSSGFGSLLTVRIAEYKQTHTVCF